MAFYRNLKIILDSQGLTNYQAGAKCDIPPQTFDNIFKNKVEKPKTSTLEKLSKGLNVSINTLMYGTDTFDSENFYSILEKKKVSFKDLIIETGADPLLLSKNIIPPDTQQQSIAKYLNLKASEIFILSRFSIDYLRAKNVSPYIRPDINSEPKTEKDLLKLYNNLSPMSKRIIYNLTYDFSLIETEYILEYIQKDYWEK